MTFQEVTGMIKWALIGTKSHSISALQVISVLQAQLQNLQFLVLRESIKVLKVKILAWLVLQVSIVLDQLSIL